MYFIVSRPSGGSCQCDCLPCSNVLHLFHIVLCVNLVAIFPLSLSDHQHTMCWAFKPSFPLINPVHLTLFSSSCHKFWLCLLTLFRCSVRLISCVSNCFYHKSAFFTFYPVSGVECLNLFMTAVILSPSLTLILKHSSSMNGRTLLYMRVQVGFFPVPKQIL